MADVNLTETLQLVADTIVESLGFEVAVINLIEDERAMVVAAVSGPDEVKQALLNRRQGLEGWATLVSVSQPWGERLRFLDHATTPVQPADMLSWIPDMEITVDPNAWHPEDALFAPLESPEGQLLGMLSVDVPRDGLRPSAAVRHALEAFAVTAALAIEHGMLAAESRRSAARFQAVFDSSPIPVALLDEDRRYVSVNDAYCRFLDRVRAELLGHDPLEFTHPDDLGEADALSRAVRSGSLDGLTYEPVEKRYLRPDGSEAWGRLHLVPLQTGDSPGFVVAQIEDITASKRAEARLVRQANFDELTGLPNRVHAMSRLGLTLAEEEVDGKPTAVFFCDVDRLKLVNDAHGHAVGDAYIQEIARRIKAGVRADDTVGRLGGDEFVVILPGVGSASEATAVARRVIDEVRKPLSLYGESFSPSVSLGIAYSQGTVRTPDELLARADTAMYQAKTQDRGSWRVHDDSVTSSAVGQLQLRTELARALDRHELVLHYQPVVRLVDDGVIGYEALLRWQHPTRGLLAPGAFLDVIVDSEFETPVTDWVLLRACLDAARRPAAQRRVSVNVTSTQFARPDLPDVVAACLSASGLAPYDLVLELTEDRLLSRSDGAELLERMRRLGVSIAIDDFGSGYAGLQYLQRFPAVDIIKLDRGFVAGVGRDKVSENIVRAVVELVRSCSLRLIVEGVETAEQAEFLRGLGTDAAQGYYFGRPAPPDKL